MANYVSVLSDGEKWEANRHIRKLNNKRREIERKSNNWMDGAEDVLNQYKGLPSQFQSADIFDNYNQVQKARVGAMDRLANPAGVPEPQLMQDHKLMEQVNREARIKAANYWSQTAEDIALGKKLSHIPKSSYPTTPQAPTLSNVSFDFSGQPAPQAPQAPQAPIRTPEDFQSRAGMFAKEPLTRAQQLTVDVPNMIEATLRQSGVNIKAPFVTVDDYLNNPNQPSIAESWSNSGAKAERPEYKITSAEAGPKADNIAIDPISKEVTVNPEQFLTWEEAQAKAEKEKYAGMDYGQMQMAQAMERTQLEDNAQAASTASPTASTASPTAPTQPNSFATSQGAATTVSGTPISEFLSGKALPEQGLMQAENPMYGDNSLSRGLGGDAATQAFQDASAAREARIEQNFGISRGPDSRDGEDASGAPTALFKEQAEAEGLTGRAKSEYVQEKTRMWGEQKEDRATAKSSAVAEAARKKIELGLKISEEEREIVKADNEKREKKNITAAAIQGAIENLRLMEGVSEEIKALTFKSLTEGNFARAASLISPTSTSAQIDRLTETLSGDAFVDSILELKRMGGTVGQVSNEEGKKLTAAKQKLMTTGMSDPERRKAVDLYLKTKQTSVQNLYNAYVRDFGLEAAKEAFGGSSFTGKSATQPKYANDVDHAGPVDSYLMEKSK